MEILGTPNDEFMKKISSESVSSLSSSDVHALNFYQLIITLEFLPPVRLKYLTKCILWKFSTFLFLSKILKKLIN